MYVFLGILFGLFLGLTKSTETESLGVVPSNCLHCICVVESHCKAIGCHMDVGSLSCGYYQIKKPYWIDCHKPKPSRGCSGDTDCWKKCADDKTCATQCVNSYMQRYSHQPGCKANCESYARLHNGGPSGCTNPGTIGYWNKVKACLGGEKTAVDTRLLFLEFIKKSSDSNKL